MIAHTGSASLRVTDIKTANYAAEPGELVQCDASGGSFTIGLPANPRVNDRIGVKLLRTADGHGVTVARNGNTIEGTTADWELSNAGGVVELLYNGAGVWLAAIAEAAPASSTRFEPPKGRLTLASESPVLTSDITAASTLYYTPYLGNTVCLYNGERWRAHAFGECSLTLSGLTAGKNYDVFLYETSGTPTLELSAAWSNDTTRADALALQDGVPVKSGATMRLYLGTFRATGTTTTAFTFTAGAGPRRALLWNRYNQVFTPVIAQDTGGDYNYTSTTPRKSRNTDGTKVEFVLGAPASVRLDATQRSVNTVAATRISGVGFNSAASVSQPQSLVVPAGNITMHSHHIARAGAGYHFAHVIELSDAIGTTTWGSPLMLEAQLWC